MTIGEKRMRVAFQTPSVSRDDFGEPDQSWSTLVTAWALVQPMKGRERFAANEVQADVDHRIVVRNSTELATLGPGDRATWSGHTYDIKAVIHRDHRRSEIEILAMEHL